MGKRIGTMPCVACGETVPVKEQDKKPLISASCNYCGTQVYCRDPEGDAFMRKKVKLIAAPAPEPTPTPTPEPKKDTPPPPKKSSLLDL